MDRERLRASAEKIDAVLKRHAGENADVDTLAQMLAPLIAAAKAGTITAPIPWNDIPGSYPYNEGYYDDFPDVMEAFAEFKVMLNGSEHLADELRQERG